MKEFIKDVCSSIKALFAFFVTMGCVNLLTFLLDFLYYHWESKWMIIKAMGLDNEMYDFVKEMYDSATEGQLIGWPRKVVLKTCKRYIDHDFKRSFDVV